MTSYRSGQEKSCCYIDLECHRAFLEGWKSLLLQTCYVLCAQHKLTLLALAACSPAVVQMFHMLATQPCFRLVSNTADSQIGNLLLICWCTVQKCGRDRGALLRFGKCVIRNRFSVPALENRHSLSWGLICLWQSSLTALCMGGVVNPSISACLLCE